MSSTEGRINWSPPPNSYFHPYLRSIQPPLDTDALGLGLVFGDERTTMRTPVTGDMSLVLTYKGKEGAVASMEDNSEDLVILQLQGARGAKGYRVSTGMRWVEVFCHQADQIASHPDTPYRRIAMPHPIMVEGVLRPGPEITEKALSRYAAAIGMLGLTFSDLDRLFVRDVSK